VIADPAQMPALHASVTVQALPSSHPVPSGAVGLEQKPLTGLHVPAVWHWSSGTHATGFDPAHAPDWHVSVWVQALPSLHGDPFGAAGFEQEPVPGSHVPATWH
jgi:hypothetical protein